MTFGTTRMQASFWLRPIKWSCLALKIVFSLYVCDDDDEDNDFKSKAMLAFLVLGVQSVSHWARK